MGDIICHSSLLFLLKAKSLEYMSELTTKSLLHKRITNFVDWIKPESSTRDQIKERAENVRKNIKAKAEEDELIVESTPNAGSFATHTGLRRHYRGDSEVEGQDVDLPFVINPETVSGEELDELLSRFKKYANASYPDSEIEATKSSVKLKFADNVSFDLVPMLSTDDSKEQVIIRSTGEEIKTSVQKHAEFIKARNRKSNEQEGRVKFNECVRLLKWWRDFQSANSYALGSNDAPPSFLINLLAAYAFDELGVEKTYAETLFKWSAFLAHISESRTAILFTDYNTPEEDSEKIWTVMDPVNPENNVVGKWNNLKVDELSEWLRSARDDWSRIVHFDHDGNDSKALEYLIKLFGNPFKNHCED